MVKEMKVEPLRVPGGPEAQRVLDDYLVYYQTRLPVLRRRAAQLRANRRRTIESFFRSRGMPSPFD